MQFSALDVVWVISACFLCVSFASCRSLFAGRWGNDRLYNRKLDPLGFWVSFASIFAIFAVLTGVKLRLL